MQKMCNYYDEEMCMEIKKGYAITVKYISHEYQKPK